MEKDTNGKKNKDYVNKNSKIDVADIQGIENFSYCLIVIYIILIILSVALNIVPLNIGAIISSIITGVASLIVITIFTRCIVGIGCTAKKNQETLNKLLDALDDNTNSTIKNIKTQILEENAKEDESELFKVKKAYQLPQNKQLCPICYTVFDKSTQICPNCGYDTKNPKQMNRYMSNVASKNECPCCFAKISPNDTECPNCGYKLKER